MKISIITICRNEGPGLRTTLESVQNQTTKDFEHIFIDGLSDDPVTKQIIGEFRPSFSYFISERDSGIYNAQNKGLEQASGEFVLFLNAGDYLSDSNVLSKVIETMQRRAADVYYGNMWIENNDGSKILGTMPEEIHIFHMLRSTLWHPVSFIRKSLFKTYGTYNEEFKIVSDYEFFLKLVLSRQVTFHHTGFPISVFNTRGIGSRADFQVRHINERLTVQKKWVPLSIRIIYNISERAKLLRKVPGIRLLAKKLVS